MENKSLFKNKNFTLNFFGALVSNIGATLYSFAVSFYILKITGNDSFMQGLYLAVVGVVSLVFVLIGGVLADRFNKAKIMYICDYLKGGILLLTTSLMFVDGNVLFILVLLFIAGIVGSAVSGIFSPASSALLPLIVEEEQLQKANSYFSLLSSMQTILGIVLAGVLYSVLPIIVLFYIVASCYVVSAISEMFIKYNHIKNEKPMTLKSSIGEIGEGFTYIFKHKALFTLIVCMLFINFFFAPIASNFFAYFIASDVAPIEYLFKDIMSAEMWNSIFEVLFSIGAIIGSIIIGFIHTKRVSTTIRMGLTFIGVLALGISFGYLFLVEKNALINPYIISLSILCLLVGFTIPIINVPVQTSIQKITSQDMLGKVSSVLTIGSSGLVPLASLLAGIIISGFGVSALLFACAIGFILTDLIVLFSKNISNL